MSDQTNAVSLCIETKIHTYHFEGFLLAFGMSVFFVILSHSKPIFNPPSLPPFLIQQFCAQSSQNYHPFRSNG